MFFSLSFPLSLYRSAIADFWCGFLFLDMAWCVEVIEPATPAALLRPSFPSTQLHTFLPPHTHTHTHTHKGQGKAKRGRRGRGVSGGAVFTLFTGCVALCIIFGAQTHTHKHTPTHTHTKRRVNARLETPRVKDSAERRVS